MFFFFSAFVNLCILYRFRITTVTMLQFNLDQNVVFLFCGDYNQWLVIMNGVGKICHQL